MYRGFKGIWIPAEIWLSKELTVMEKLFFVEIQSLDNEDGCYASNQHFAKFFGVTKGRCSQIINALKDKGFIKVEYLKDDKETKGRIIKSTVKLVKNDNERLNTPCLENADRVFNKLNTPYLENAKDSNTLFSNTFRNKEKNTTYSKRKTQKTSFIDEMVNDYTDNQELLDSLFDFVDMRKQIKKPITTKSTVTRLLNKLDKLSGGDDDKKIKLLNASIDHCWQDVYERSLDDDGTTGNPAKKEVDPKDEKYGYLYCNL